ncbi:hypothetical protein [Angustibacter luteus]|uniref:Nuclear transport factor 2 family protein n=1 Tax=Angustibacter luteus TaxID=658456 RepID=A0ABW1JJ67_9ACTN
MTEVMRTFWQLIDAADWVGLRALLDDDFRARFAHTGEEFDADGFVRFNADYPGRWRAEVVELVRDGDREVTRTRVFDDSEEHWVASFGESRDGRLVALVEVWADGTSTPPEGSRASS